MKKLINLTPHNVVLVTEETTITIEPSGIVPRLKEIQEEIGEINRIPVMKKSFGEIDNMPNEEENTVYIISALAASALKHRDDVYVPNDIVRDKNGNIVGCRSLAKI